MTKHKQDLEEKLMRIEKAIETFSKKTVYVAFWSKLNKLKKWLIYMLIIKINNFL